DIVAAFEVRVVGLEPDWVTIRPETFNLYEGGRATVTISFEAPREPTSSAGTHDLAIEVLSANYPGRMSRTVAALTINPYYEFAVGELTPKEQTVSWFSRTGEVTVPIANKGNSQTPMRLQGEDDERGLRFEFEVPGEEARLVRQAEMRLAPDESMAAVIGITPVKRRLIALRSKQLTFTITASLVEGAQTPRSVMGRVKSRPLIGPLLLLLILATLATVLVILFRPATRPGLRMETPTSAEGSLVPVSYGARPGRDLVMVSAQNQSTATHGEPVLLRYDAKRFENLSTLHILNYVNSWFLQLELQFRPGDGDWVAVPVDQDLAVPDGSVEDTPLVNGQYRLRAHTWVSRLIPVLTGYSLPVQVFVQPVEPVIADFRADQNPVLRGDEVTLFWNVSDAETLMLAYNGIEETLQGDQLESGQRTFQPDVNTTYTLVATNGSWPSEVRRPLEVQVMAQPIPTPVILRFDVDPLEITEGEAVRIEWEVSGADSVAIDPVDQNLPIKGNIGDQPTSLRTYQLIAFKTGEDGTQVQSESQLREVIVNPQPTPTPVPVAPEVQLFQALPDEFVGGDRDEASLTWSVSGATTNIEITAPGLQLSGLKAQDTITVPVAETTLFVLTAYNGELSRSAPAEVKVLEPTPTPTATPEPTPPPPTPTPVPPPIIAYYKAEGLQPPDDQVTFQSMVDGPDGTTYVYTVVAGSRVVLSWEARDAETLSIQGFGTQPAQGSLTIPDPVTSSGSYVLTAENDGGNNQVKAFIQLNVTAPPPPSAPYNVHGIEYEAQDKNEVFWSYSSADKDRIEGFRIYRADVPPGTNFAEAGTVSSGENKWVDENLTPTCGKAYYVVAFYTDPLTGDPRETQASDTSWYSQPCP
ncbi:MAG: hypothetical protein PVI68_10625, partial [Anaerolineae bacterium]